MENLKLMNEGKELEIENIERENAKSYKLSCSFWKVKKQKKPGVLMRNLHLL
jgi:hypothetical protein